MSIMVGVGRGAQEGVLVKNAEALERLEKVTTLVVDKTGTLTEGKPKLMDVLPVEGIRREGVFAPRRLLEQNSEHPLAAAIVRARRIKASRSTGEGLPLRHGGRSRRHRQRARAVMVGKPEFPANEKITAWKQLEATGRKASGRRQDRDVRRHRRQTGRESSPSPTRSKSTTAEAIRDLHALG
jgi:Cu+-exporting ATPase